MRGAVLADDAVVSIVRGAVAPGRGRPARPAQPRSPACCRAGGTRSSGAWTARRSLRRGRGRGLRRCRCPGPPSGARQRRRGGRLDDRPGRPRGRRDRDRPRPDGAGRSAVSRRRSGGRRPSCSTSATCWTARSRSCTRRTSATTATPVSRVLARAGGGCVGRARATLDRLIDAAAAGWSADRMAVLERNVLRLAVCELRDRARCRRRSRSTRRCRWPSGTRRPRRRRS